MKRLRAALRRWWRKGLDPDPNCRACRGAGAGPGDVCPWCQTIPGDLW